MGISVVILGVRVRVNGRMDMGISVVIFSYAYCLAFVVCKITGLSRKCKLDKEECKKKKKAGKKFFNVLNQCGMKK